MRKVKKEPMSKTRKRYVFRLIGRIIVLIVATLVCFFRKDWLSILEGDNFFRKFSIFHLLWIIWVFDMILQLVPVRKKVPLGSQKLFKQRFKPIRDKINYQSLHDYVVATTKSAYKVFLLWCALLVVLGVLYYNKVIDRTILLMVSITFYVCDLICVLIWCPFRLMMRTRCCTTCRIFNWDHLMMFSPLVFVNSFFTRSLFVMSVAVWLVWELCIMMYPERFWDKTNQALKCSECTDKLCTQYCRKLTMSVDKAVFL